MDKNAYVKIVIQMLNGLNESDLQFLKQLYTIVKNHIAFKATCSSRKHVIR